MTSIAGHRALRGIAAIDGFDTFASASRGRLAQTLCIPELTSDMAKRRDALLPCATLEHRTTG
ncbi:hypothetical protein BCEN4_450100 [Burkholderia cenocepacia]|nr:hypothetical protein BCEN4_450100 [Burkholderia cenocepacia]